MNSLRHLLLVVVLCFAQLAAGAHAVGHAAGKEGALPAHACELCLVAHDLASALPSLAVMPPAVPSCLVPEALQTHARTAFPSPLARQRDPPAA